MLRHFASWNKTAENLPQPLVQPPAAVSLRFPVKHKHYQHEPVMLERPWWAPAAVASDGDATSIVPPDRADEAILRYVRELAKRLARDDHDAEIAASQTSNSAISESP
jgi:hypothetical protein